MVDQHDLPSRELHIDEARCMKLEGSASSQANANFAFFRPGQAYPQCIVKVPRNPSLMVQIVREEQNLQQLQNHVVLPDALKRQIPRPRGRVPIGRSQALVLSALPGTVMSRRIQVRRVTCVLEQAVEWLAQFHQSTVVRRLVMQKQHIEPLVYSYVDSLGDVKAYAPEGSVTAKIEAVQRDVCQWLHRVIGTEIPMVMTHGDFSPHNILVTKGQISGVFDWSEARAEGIPFEDLLHFPIVTFTSSQFVGRLVNNSPSRKWQSITAHAEYLQDYVHNYSKLVDIDESRPWSWLPWYLLVTALKDLLPWRVNIKSCRHWLNLAEESMQSPLPERVRS
jgi:thiamine kinase-like enzyme